MSDTAELDELAPAPVERDPDLDDRPLTPRQQVERLPAPRYPTEADVLALSAELDDDGLDPRARVTMMRQAIDAGAKRASKRAGRVDDPDPELVPAPVFPTFAHELALRDAIPALADHDCTAILRAGPRSYEASLAAGVVVLDPETEVPE